MNIPSDEQLMSVFAARVEKRAGMVKAIKSGVSKTEKALSREIKAASRTSELPAVTAPPAAAAPPTPPAAVKPGRRGRAKPDAAAKPPEAPKAPKPDKAEKRLKDNRVITNNQRKSVLERTRFGKFLDENFITGGKKRSTLASKAQTITKAQLADTTPAGQKALAKQLAANEALKKYDRNMAIKRIAGLSGLGAGTLGVGAGAGFGLGSI